MRRAVILAVLIATADCAPKSKSVPVIPSWPAIEAPSVTADVVLFPTWVNDDVQVCVEEPFPSRRRCVSVALLRTFVHGAREAN